MENVTRDGQEKDHPDHLSLTTRSLPLPFVSGPKGPVPTNGERNGERKMGRETDRPAGCDVFRSVWSSSP